MNGPISVVEHYDIHGRLSGTKTIYDSLGNKSREEPFINGVLTGLVTNYFPSGKTESTVMYAGNRRNGDYQSYYPGGKPDCKGTYRSDRETGKWTCLFENGHTRKVSNWKEGTLINSREFTEAGQNAGNASSPGPKPADAESAGGQNKGAEPK